MGIVRGRMEGFQNLFIKQGRSGEGVILGSMNGGGGPVR